MRHDDFDTGRVRYNHAPAEPRPFGIEPERVSPFAPWYDAPPPPPEEPPVGERRRRLPIGRWIVRGIAAGIVLLIVAIAWLAVTAPLSKSLKPPTPPSITLTDREDRPIARRGAVIGAPVDAAKLPDHVREAFLAIEDRRFYSHWGIDPRGIARAAMANLGSGGVRQGGSTITQQLAKNAFLDSDRTAARKIREAMIALWLEAWLSKDEILSRYLSNVYFGDNVYGLRAASEHYFGREPEDMNIGQAAMLAGLVKAPSRLAPTDNLKGARARQAVVVGAMVDAGFLTKREADAVQPQRVRKTDTTTLPTGTYFADWVLPEARDQAGEVRNETTVKTTLDRDLQRAAERAVKRAGLRQAQVALVAMKPDGEVVAMVGGKDYKTSPFNRATQARRQPGSTFKLFVYLAALRQGMSPDTMIEDEPVTIGDWTPKNSDGRYLGPITLRQAFARSSNVAAARLAQKVGVRSVVKAARDLGISTDIPSEATIALGTSTVSLLELTAAYAAFAAEQYPVQPHGLAQAEEKSWYQTLTGGGREMPGRIERDMRDLLAASAQTGTGRAARLSVDTFGKTGTTQDNRDALFVGFANGLVAGVWVGNDDNTPNPGLSGGGIPARIWRDFMTDALDLSPAAAPAPAPEVNEMPEEDGVPIGDMLPPGMLPPGVIPPGVLPDGPVAIPLPPEAADRARPLAEELRARGLDLQMTPDGSIVVGRRPRADARDRPRGAPLDEDEF